MTNGHELPAIEQVPVITEHQQQLERQFEDELILLREKVRKLEEEVETQKDKVRFSTFSFTS